MKIKLKTNYMRVFRRRTARSEYNYIVNILVYFNCDLEVN